LLQSSQVEFVLTSFTGSVRSPRMYDLSIRAKANRNTHMHLRKTRNHIIDVVRQRHRRATQAAGEKGGRAFSPAVEARGAGIGRGERRKTTSGLKR
jgi:hypothetical protein